MHISEWPKKMRQAGRLFLSKKDNLTLLMVVGTAFLIIAAVVLTFAFRLPKSEENITSDKEDALADRHPLTGEKLSQPLSKLPQVFGVMIENSADAWPLSGVEDAFLVIEAPVEGFIPRFIAFFSAEQEVERVGPVRSARPYYVDWNDEFGALYAHVGGSPEALALIAKYETRNLNEFYQGEYFWRAQNRYAPHNTYTSTQELNSALQEVGESEFVYNAWKFKDDTPTTGQPLNAVIDWSGSSVYDITWSYETLTNSYVRSQGRETRPSKSLDGDFYVAKNIIVIATDVVSIDNVDRKRITTVGGGDAVVIQDGKAILGRWEKSSRTNRLRVYDAQGIEVALNAGPTWIEVVPTISSVSLEEIEE